MWRLRSQKPDPAGGVVAALGVGAVGFRVPYRTASAGAGVASDVVDYATLS